MEQELGKENIVDKSDVIIIKRRSFIGALVSLGLAGMGAILAIPVLRSVLYPLNASAPAIEWSDVGDVGEFADSKAPVRRTITFAQQDSWREALSSQSVYVNRTADGKFDVLSAICPHLGCSLSWQEDQNEFVCPCHGGRFAPNGKHVSGPPPRAMDDLRTRVNGGKLQVHFEFFRSNVPNHEKLG
jgi:menaquinol-cytochrome c reductase iron-sulfur subunit